MVHTEKGMHMLVTSSLKYASVRLTGGWRTLLERMVEEAKAEVGEGKAIIALSGGVDFSVATVIAAKALGDRPIAVFVDHGFMRENEPEFVKNTFQDFKINLIIVNVKERFLKSLRAWLIRGLKGKLLVKSSFEFFEEQAEKAGANIRSKEQFTMIGKNLVLESFQTRLELIITWQGF